MKRNYSQDPNCREARVRVGGGGGRGERSEAIKI